MLVCEIFQIPGGVYVGGEVLRWVQGAGWSLGWLEEDGEYGFDGAFTVIENWITSLLS